MSGTRKVHEVIQTWVTALSAKDAKTCAELCTEDTWVRYSSHFGPDLRAYGRDSIERNMREWFNSFDNMQFTNLELSVEMDLAYTLDSWEIDPENDRERDRAHRGKCVSVYKRECDGAWKCHAVTFVDDFWNHGRG